VQVYIVKVVYIDMENKENNPTVTVDDKKDEPKKEEPAKKEK